MSMPTSLILAGYMVWSLTACSSGPPKPVLPDGLHRVPVNRVSPVPDVSNAVPAVVPAASSPVPDAPAALDTGDRS
jgi:hypothetical protein